MFLSTEGAGDLYINHTDMGHDTALMENLYGNESGLKYSVLHSYLLYEINALKICFKHNTTHNKP